MDVFVNNILNYDENSTFDLENAIHPVVIDFGFAKIMGNTPALNSFGKGFKIFFIVKFGNLICKELLFIWFFFFD
jgi:hypothetical protein